MATTNIRSTPFKVGAPATAGDAIDLQMAIDIQSGKLHHADRFPPLPVPTDLNPRRWISGPMPWEVLLDVIKASIDRDGAKRCAETWSSHPLYQKAIEALTEPIDFDDVDFEW